MQLIEFQKNKYMKNGSEFLPTTRGMLPDSRSMAYHVQR
jgi:hypothetical protein